MSTQETTNRWQRIQVVLHNYKELVDKAVVASQIASRILLVMIGVIIGGALFSSDMGSYIANLYTEGLGIVATVLILDWLAERREDRRRILDLQERLIMETGSQSNETAKHAISELGHHGWISDEDSLLKAKRLQGANLREVNLSGTNMQGADLEYANLQGADLSYADLQGAKLWYADLQGANLIGAFLLAGLLKANLQGANLTRADLQRANLGLSNLYRANLQEARLQGARLSGSNLQEANLVSTQFDENTILPDGSKWTPETDMERFTDPNHPDFWRSDKPHSPAYHDKSDAGG